MNTETKARAAADDLREHTALVDPEHGLASLLVAHAHRRRTTRAAVAMTAVAAVALAWWGGTRVGQDRPTTPAPAHSSVCPPGLVTCLGHRTYRFGLDSPVVWRIPPGYGVSSGVGASPLMVESYGSGRNDGAGVTVMEGVRPSHGASARTAAEFTSWLASRPYFRATTPRRVPLDGHPAWQVRVQLRGKATAEPDTCLQGKTSCRAVTARPTVTGVFGDMVADYTAFDVPGRGPTVVWSWSFGDPRGLARNREAVAGLSFPDR